MAMASKAFPLRQKAAEIDTTLPYKNVQAAVRMFGEKGDHPNMIKSHEKNGDMHVHELKEELARVRAQIADEQKQRASVQAELDDLKKLLQSGESLPCKDVTLVCELKMVKQQHAIALAELEEITTERNRLAQELVVVSQEKENAQRQAEEALAAAEVNAKRAEELSKEILGTKESLLLVKMACIETNKEREALWAARKKADARTASPGSPNKLSKLEHKLNAGRADFTKEDLKVIRQSLVSAREALANIDRLKAGCGSPVADATIAMELEAAKSEISKALKNDVLLESTLKELQDRCIEAKQDLDATKSELVEMRSREASAIAEIVELKSELEKVKTELKAAISCNEAFVGFSQKLQKESLQESEESNHKVNDAAKAELHALLKEEAEAVRQAELRHKTCQDTCLNAKRDRLDTVFEDGNMLLQNEASSMPHDLPKKESMENAAFGPEMRSSYKEEHRKKKFSLPSFGSLLSKSKQRSQKGTTRPAGEGA